MDLLPARIKVKLFFTDPVEPNDFVPLFHSWIQEKRFEDHLLVDVADYRYVPQGPSIILVAHEADFIVDIEDGRAGLAYLRKRAWPAGDPSDDPLRVRIRTALSGAVHAAAALESAPVPGIEGGELALWLIDRLSLRGRPERDPALLQAIRQELSAFFATDDLTVEPLDRDSRRSFGVHARLPSNTLLVLSKSLPA